MEKMGMQIKHFHFIGIGGIGMSGIAGLLMACGHTVSGSDLKENHLTQELRAQGARIFVGHDARHIEGQPIVVYSSAIKQDNPEMQEAARRKLTVIKRAQALALLMEDKCVITVAGSHGKTTTTSLLGHVLIESGISPTVVIGGVLRNIGTNACIGESAYCLAEADESDGSFLCYRPTHSIITNIDYEHLDYYGSFDAQVAAFGDYISRTDPRGSLVICADDEHLCALSRRYSGQVITYGLRAPARLQARSVEIKGLRSSFDCFYDGARIGRFELALGGEHNVSNALAVIAAAVQLGIPLETVKPSLLSYQGARRRLEIKWSGQQYTFIDDYAHHPTEIRATLAALRAVSAGRRMIIFQPHRYSRTQLLLDKFAHCFDHADYLVITDIYSAGEAPIEGITAEVLWRAVKMSMPDKEVVYVPRADVSGYVCRHLVPGDLVVTMGAGDIVNIHHEIIACAQSRDIQESQGALRDG